MKLRVLVTGATGYLGGKLVQRLASLGAEVCVLVRSAAKFEAARGRADYYEIYEYDGSIGSAINALKESMPELVVHLASMVLVSHEESDIDGLISSNILFGTHLLEAMKVSGCKCIISTGTSWQNYEAKRYSPVNLYAATKEAFDAILKYYSEVHEFKIIVLKLFDNYGESDPRKKIVYLLIKALLTQEKIHLSPGDQIIDISHVDDVISEYISAADYICKKNQRAFYEQYFVSGQRFSIKELVAEIEKILEGKINAVFGGRPYRQREVMILPEDLLLIPWEANMRPMDFSEGIKRLSIEAKKSLKN